ncbi:MAG TPA: HD domain-containing protein [Candidatus Brocadiia bacterium]|nr:HD domain-containing protein [Candidatus Brocadiia bacterium]
MKTIRDPVHGDVRLTQEETEILDSPEMQRLRGIKQLGSSFLVYPGAVHTRFEHCLGTLWMARRMCESLKTEDDSPLTDREERLIAAAALLHDVTHIPFGHTLEDERRILPRHDANMDRLLHFVDKGELGRRLRRFGLDRDVIALLSPSDNGEGKCPSLRPCARACVREIVSSTICADLLDYLARDSYFCGLKLRYDPRLMQYFRIRDGRLVLDLHKGGMLRRDAVTEVCNLLRMRYVLSERVYYHHAKIAAGVMISKAVEEAFRRGLKPRELYDLRDDSLLRHLSDRFPRVKPVRNLLEMYAARRLFKRCFVLMPDCGEPLQSELVSRYHFDDGSRRLIAEKEIARLLGRGVPSWAVAIYCPPMGMRLKEADVPVLTADGGLRPLSEFDNDEIELLKNRHRRLWKFYVFISPDFIPDSEAAGRAAAEVIGCRNQLHVEHHGADAPGAA